MILNAPGIACAADYHGAQIYHIEISHTFYQVRAYDRMSAEQAAADHHHAERMRQFPEEYDDQGQLL